MVGNLSNDSVVHVMGRHPVLAIARGIKNQSADLLCDALYAGGIRLVEVTMNTPDALHIIERWRTRFRGRIRVGAGTVLDVDTCHEAIAAGAEFLVSPNVDERVIQYAVQNGVEIFPGALTPTEIVRAWKLGATAIKVFPSGTFGAQYFKELRGPLPQIPLIAVGGITVQNLDSFLSAGAIGIGIGSNLINLKLIEEGRFDEIQTLAAQCVKAAQGASVS